MFRCLFLVSFVVVLCFGASSRKDGIISLVKSCLDIDSTTWVTHFNLSESEKDGLGIIASRNMSAGQIVIEMPYSLHFSGETVRKFLPRNLTSLHIDPQMFVAVYLAFERFKILPRREPPKWYEFFASKDPVSFLGVWADMMPDHVENSAHFDDDDWSALKSLGSFEEVPRISDLWPKIEHLGIISETQLKWGYSMLLSRSFMDIYGSAVAIPVADFFNHDFNPNVLATIEKKSVITMDVSDPILFYLPANVSEGSPLTVSYGKKSNFVFLEMYGFVIHQNPFDEYTIKCCGDGEKIGKDKLDIIDRVWGEISGFNISWDGASPSGLLKFLDSEKIDSASVGIWKNEVNRTWDSKFLKGICKKEIQRVQKIRRKRIMPLVREYLKLLRKCVT